MARKGALKMQVRPRRSVLYIPGSNQRALDKAKTLPADALILDLEDAVAPQAKESAREQVCAIVKARGFGKREIIIRVNGLNTSTGAADLAMAAQAAPDAILVPKIESDVDLTRVGTRLGELSAPPTVRVWAMMETPLAVLNASQIARAAVAMPETRLSVLVMGTNDLVKETRVELNAERIGALYWLSTCVTAARAFGVDILDGVYNAFKDADGFRRECVQGRQLGFDGKTLIHPDQVKTANEVFQPTEADVAFARKIIAAFDRPENKGKGVITVEGRMVEIMHAEIARRTIAIDEAIRESNQ
jgi:citrate lyase subunit beta / citryl-CoA lyase